MVLLSFFSQRLADMSGARLGRLFASTFVAGIASRLAVLVMAILVARQLLPDGYGAFVFATSAAVIAGHLAGLGLPALMSRLIPTYRTTGQWASLRGLLVWGDAAVAAGTLVVLAGLAAIAFLPALDDELRIGLVLSMVLLLPTALNLLRRSQLAGARQPAMSLLLDQAFAPLALALFALLVGVDDVTTAIAVFAAATVAGLLLATLYLRRALPNETWTAARSIEGRLWLAAAVPLLAGNAAKMLINRMDILMLAPLADLEAVGLYGAAFRITYALTFPQVILMTIITPLLSESIAKGKLPAVWRHFRISMVFAAITVFPIALLLVIWSEPFIALLFGEAYRTAAGTLSVLALAQCFAALSIPMVGLLIAAGGGKVFGAFSIGGLALNGALNLLLIPRYGAEGAAWATLVAFLFLACGYLWALWRLHTSGAIRPIVKPVDAIGGEPA